MIKKLPLIFVLAYSFAFGQTLTVSTTTYTPEQLITDVVSGFCGSISNVTNTSSCGIGYFNANGSGFPFSEGLVLRNGTATLTAGNYTGTNLSSSCSASGDADLQQILIQTYGNNIGQVQDVTSIKFNIVPQSETLSFNYIFASNEYGQYQCGFSDIIGFILTDIETGVKTNMAIIPGTSTPVSVTKIRNNDHNGSCTSVNPSWFGTYNVGNTDSAINMKGNTVPMTASATVIPGHQYSLKLAVGDMNDSVFDSAVFIEGGSLFSGTNCVGRIKMTAFIDSNGNNTKDSDEATFTHGSFSYQKNNTGDVSQILSSSGNGYILTDVGTDTYDLGFAIDSEYNSYYATTATYSDISFVEGNPNMYYFPITNTQPYSDVSVSLFALQQPRPGFTFKDKIAFTNNGTSATSGTISFTHDATVSVSEISESGTVATTSGFTFDYANLLPFETRYIDVKMLTPTLPTVALGDIVENTVAISSVLPDINTNNNSDNLNQVIVGAFDPNDKTESHGGKIEFDDFNAEDYLDYTICFQNEGTASAITIKINDVLSADLDENSLRMIDASHGYTLTRTGNNLVWTFDEIHLPGKVENEPLSHGYVHFKIKPKAGFQVGDIIPNVASIYFDFNPAIVTNTANVEFVETLSISNNNKNNISIYPNPARDAFTVATHSVETIQNLKIIDISGKKIVDTTPAKSSETLDVSNLRTGIYMIEIITSSRLKVIKKLIIN